MLTDLLTKEKIRFTNKELSWQEAIELAAQPLLDKHEIEERYIKAIIDKECLIKEKIEFLKY